MKQNLIIFAVAFAGALGGANVQPLLSGVGKIIFPENATPATISASGGALTAAAGGTNQNVILSPSGTGVTSSASPFHLDTGAAPTNSQFALKANGLGALSLLNFAPDNVKVLFDTDWVSNSLIAANASVAILLKSAAKLSVFGGTGQTVGNPVAVGSLFSVDLATGNTSAAGNVNAAGVFQKGGAAGVGTGLSVTVCQGVSAGPPATCSATCTLIFSGGIRTGGTCN